MSIRIMRIKEGMKCMQLRRERQNQAMQEVVMEATVEDMVGVTSLMEVDMEVIVEVTMVRDLLSLDMVVIAEVIKADMDIAEDIV